MELGVDVPSSLPGLLIVAVALYVAWKLFDDREFKSIPAVGYTFPVLNWITVVQHITNGRKLISEGYKRHPNAIFRIAIHDGWLIVANGPQLVEEIRRAPDPVLSFTENAVRVLQLKYTIGNDILDAPFHTDVIRGALTQNIGARFDDLRDEIARAFGEEVGANEEWKAVPAVETVRRIVTRVSNRVFVDGPLCRNSEWIQLNIDYAIDIALGAIFIQFVPRFLKPLAGRLLWRLKLQRRRANDIVGPLIAERLREFAEHGDKADNLPNDMITWLIEACPPELRQVPLLTNRVLLVNVASLHTTSNTFLHVLYKLAANPAWAEPLREEVGRIVSAEGWTKASLAKMRRLDSFIRETQRIQMIDLTSMNRWVTRPYTFSNGVRIPSNCLLVTSADALQTDIAWHGEDATVFSPWRYAGIAGKDATKHQMVATSPTHLAFGHGRRACPGRHFVAHELKGMLAHVALDYDVRFKDGKRAPPDLEFGNTVVPRESQVEFRRRQGA